MLTLQKIAIKDPATTDVVVLSNIMDGVDGAAVIGWTQEGESATIEDGQTVEHTLNGELDVKVLRGTSSELTILNGLIGKRVEISGWTLEGFLVFRDNPILNRNPDFNSAILNDQIHVTTKAIKGYVEE